jgi:hypothetical protein
MIRKWLDRNVEVILGLGLILLFLNMVFGIWLDLR